MFSYQVYQLVRRAGGRDKRARERGAARREPEQGIRGEGETPIVQRDVS
jgi:hypothetical protein